MTANGSPDLLTRFAAVATERRPTMLRMARRVVGADDAEDVVQQTLLQALRALERFQGDDGGLAAWLLTSTHHTALDWKKHRGYVARFCASGMGATGEPWEWLEVLADPDPNPEEAAIRREEQREARPQAAAVLARLPLSWRRALWATCAEERTNREAAPLLGTSWTALKSIRARASRRCRALAA